MKRNKQKTKETRFMSEYTAKKIIEACVLKFKGKEITFDACSDFIREQCKTKAQHTPRTGTINFIIKAVQKIVEDKGARK